MNGVYQLLYEGNKNELLIIIFYNIALGISEVVELIFLQLAINEAFPPVNKNKIYLYVLGLGLAWLLKVISGHNIFYDSNLIATKVKNAIILMIYEKVAGLSKNIVDGHEIGRITNMISNDFNTV